MDEMKVKLAEALLRRKELEGKVKQLLAVKTTQIFEVRATRVKAHEGLDDVVVTVPRVTMAQVTQEYDHYSRQLRLCDAAIQQMNWTTEMENAENYMSDWVAPQPMQQVK
jgi:hypothetical protein